MRTHPGEMRSRLRTAIRLCTTTVAVAALVLLALPSGAAAAAPPFLWQSPTDGLSGSDAGRLFGPQGIAADPSSGHLYVSDNQNRRISEFDAWGQFVKSWGWGVADGSDELQTCGPEASPPTLTCLEGSTGSGAGQFGSNPGLSGGPLGGIAVDEAGAVYVADTENFRIQKFDSDGNFILTFGDEVNETTGGEVCTATSEEVCGKGTGGEGEGQFTSQFGNYIAVGPAGTIFVGGPKGTIQEFEADGTFKQKVTLEGELDGAGVASLAIDSTGSFYVLSQLDHSHPQQHLYKFSPTGSLLTTIDTEFELEYFDESFESIRTTTVTLSPEAPLAVDDSDNLYAAVRYAANGTVNEVIEFDPSGALLLPPGSGFGAEEMEGKENILFVGLATNTVTEAGETAVYMTTYNGVGNGDSFSFAAAYGPPPLKWPPPQQPPEIGEQYAVSADPDAATVRAAINPSLRADTSYRVEYGTGRCSEGGCPLQTVSTALGAGVTDAFARTQQVTLPDLAPQTTYRFRFVAVSSGGGPVYGVAPEGGEASAATGLEGTFTTPARPAPLPAADPCPNSPFRSGPSAFLPDCRAYEMVTPVDKDNGEVFDLYSSLNERIHMNQSAPGGNKLAYTSYRAFADAKSAPAVSQYVAERHPAEGWSTDAVSPPRGTTYMLAGPTLENQFRAFSEDLCEAWLVHDTDPPLAPQAPSSVPNVYKTDLCDGEESYQALTRSAPAEEVHPTYAPQVQGTSSDGRITVMRIPGQLEVDRGPKAAASGIELQCYQFEAGRLRLVSVLPSGLANSTGCSVGFGGGNNPRESNLNNAVSEDGSRIFWTASSASTGRIFLRIDGRNPTVAVSQGGEALSGVQNQSTFLAAASDGSKAIYAVGGLAQSQADLYEFDVATQTTIPIAGEVRGIVGASEDASRIYLVSREVLDEGASPGAENLYLYEAGAGFRYIAELSAADRPDAIRGELSPISVQPYTRGSRVTEDGLVAVFTSATPVTGFDNTDVDSGMADREVFRYDAAAKGGEGQLDCVSCNPSGVRPRGRGVRLSPAVDEQHWYAARIPAWETALYPTRVLSQDGSRLFFESFEALTPRDINGKQDVYQWQQPGSGECTAASPSYSPPNGGCLSLISSGQSPQDSSFVDASADGRDVFIATASSLLPQDPGLIDIYDARVGGGFAQPAQPAPCQGEACQGPAASPDDPTPASATFLGPSNPRAKSKPRRCPKGKRRVRRAGKARCMPKAGARRKGRARHGRRTGR